MKHVTATVKKSFALVLALVLALGMTACGNGESSSSETASSAVSSEVSSEAVSSEAVSSEGASSEAAPEESAAGEEETTGSKTITLTVVHGDGTSNDITVSTDAENLRTLWRPRASSPGRTAPTACSSKPWTARPPTTGSRSGGA